MISVCIATYNGAKYIAEQLASILKQLSAEDEVVVSDDGSTDGTIDIVRSLNDRRIRIVDGPRRHSPTLNFEWALRNAKGEYIFLADQDDVWLEGKVTRCVEELQMCDCVVSDARVTDSLLNTTSESLFQLMHVKRGRLSNLLWRNGYTGCCMAFKREVLNKALPFPTDISMHDIWIGNVAAFCGSLHFINDRLLLFRRHDTTASCNGKGSNYSLWQKFSFRWHTLKNIVKLKTGIR